MKQCWIKYTKKIPKNTEYKAELRIRIGFNADPDMDPDPAFFVNGRIRILIQGFDDQKLGKISGEKII